MFSVLKKHWNNLHAGGYYFLGYIFNWHNHIFPEVESTPRVMHSARIVVSSECATRLNPWRPGFRDNRLNCMHSFSSCLVLRLSHLWI